MKTFNRVSAAVIIAAVLTVAITFGLAGSVRAATTRVYLGAADSFAVLAGAAVTNVPTSAITGNVGLSPAAGDNYDSGVTQAQVTGTIYSVNAAGPLGYIENPGLLTTAKNALTAAYNDAAGRPYDLDYGVTDNQLGGKTLYPGVYRFGHAATANLIGTLTLDANGDPDPVWIFQATSDLVTADGAPGVAGSSVVLINGATPCDVFWQVSSSGSHIGTYAEFVGNIMADQSISLLTGATLDGSVQARIGQVSLDQNTITKGPCALAPTPTPTPPTPAPGSDTLVPGSGLPYTGK